MYSIRRKLLTAILFISLLVTTYMWYSASDVSRLSVITTVNYAGILQTSNETEDLNELQQLKARLERSFEKYYETYSKHSATNSSLTPKQSPQVSSSHHQSSNLGDLYQDVEINSLNMGQSELPSTLSQESVTVTESDINEAYDSQDNISHNEMARGHSKDHNFVNTDEGTNRHQVTDSQDLQRKKSELDQLAQSLLLQALMKKAASNKPQLLSTVAEKPTYPSRSGCKTTGSFPAEESKAIWIKFKTTLEKYADFHHEQLQKLKAGNHTVRTLTWSCHNPIRCAGIGDQLYRIQEALIFAIAFNRVLSLHWNPASHETMKYLKPNKIDWSYFNGTQGMHEYHDAELQRIKVMDTTGEFEPFYNLLASENHTHVTVNYELQVPFMRGMTKAIRSKTGMRVALEESGFTSLITDKKRIPTSFLSGELLRYLFHFKGYVVDKVDQVQRELDISDKPYLAVHLRTGFLGMKQEEEGHFNAHKIYRNPKDWEETLACAVKLADRLYGQESSIFLATDSSKVKELAVERYGKRYVMVNVMLQHVASSGSKEQGKLEDEKMDIIKYNTSNSDLIPIATNWTSSILNVNGIDGYTATWIEFLLLARASAMVHSISGFSSVASQYCSMHNQYHVPNCGK